MHNHQYQQFPIAEELDPEELAELLNNRDWKHLITELDGKYYNEETLYFCETCEQAVIDHDDLDDNENCELCATDLEAEANHIRQESMK